MTESLNPEICFVDPEIFKNLQVEEKDALTLLGKPLTTKIESFLKQLNVSDQPVILGAVHSSAVIEGAVYIAKGAKVGPFAYIQGPTYIGPGAEVRHGAYVRGSVYAAAHAVIGHTTEVKGSVFGVHAKAGHFAYVGDSLLGDHVNLGAGTKLANLKMRGDQVKFKHPDSGRRLPSGLRKFGAILGSKCQTGCNAVLSPGSILLAGTAVMPCFHFHGTLTEGIAGS